MNVIKSDLNSVKTSIFQKIYLYSKILYIYLTFRPKIQFISEKPLSSLNDILDIKNKLNKLFMYRKLHENYKLPYHPPFKIFEEKSESLYKNYLQTANNLLGHSFNNSEINRCKEYLVHFGFVLSWSNTSILLQKALENLDIYSQLVLSIITFGSPILLQRYNTHYCLNVYHEDDWILNIIDKLYKIKISKLKRNIIYEYTINNKLCEFIILSRDNFNNNIDPHKCYNIFL